jgi:hypothetical protein
MKKLLKTAPLLILLVACKEKPVGAPNEVAFYRASGSFTSPSDNWKIEINRDDLGLSVTRNVTDESIAGKFEGTASVSPSGWTNKSGFFCAVDKCDRIWAFDGESRIWILERYEDGTRSMGISLAGGLPPEIESKLPPEFVKKLAEQAGSSNGG